MENHVDSNIKIYKTKDYDKFKFLDHNRKTTNNLVLEECITCHNKLHLNPIIVSKDMEVIDGQHRLRIAKKNRLEVYYVIDQDPEIETVQKLNTGRKNWTLQDYLHHYVSLGIKDYIFLEKIIKSSKIPLNKMVVAFSILDKQSIKKFKEGSLSFSFTHDEITIITSYFRDVLEAWRGISKCQMFSRGMTEAVLKIVSTLIVTGKRE